MVCECGGATIRPDREGFTPSGLASPHCGAESLLPLEQMCFDLADQHVRPVGQLPAPLDQGLRRVPHLLRALSYVGRQRHAAEELRAYVLREVLPLAHTNLRSASGILRKGCGVRRASSQATLVRRCPITRRKAGHDTASRSWSTQSRKRFARRCRSATPER